MKKMQIVMSATAPNRDVLWLKPCGCNFKLLAYRNCGWHNVLGSDGQCSDGCSGGKSNKGSSVVDNCDGIPVYVGDCEENVETIASTPTIKTKFTEEPSLFHFHDIKPVKVSSKPKDTVMKADKKPCGCRDKNK